MCFLISISISIFLCFALVPKLVPRTVDFHWYWYRILQFWYRDMLFVVLTITSAEIDLSSRATSLQLVYCKYMRVSYIVSPFSEFDLGLNWYGKTTLFTIFIIALKAKACDYVKECYISETCLRCSANHNTLGQLANQSTLSYSEGGSL